MSNFTEPLAVEAIPGTDLWRTLRPLVYFAGEEGSAERYEVPRGFPTDFGSIPRAAWPLVGHPAERPAGYVLHDWLYVRQETSRRRADELLREALGVLGYGLVRRQTIYLAVRSAGWAPWRRYEERRR